MYIKADKNINKTSSARLKSIPQSANEVLCVSFWYHMFGNSIGSLKFVSKHSGEPETVVWMRSGTQGNKWRYADLTIKSDRPVQVSFEAVVGGDQGTIAIDNVVVSSSENGSCPPERECTFQGSACGLLSTPSADFNWERMTGMLQPASSSGPTADHTLGTEQGYYLSAQLWRHPVGSRGAVMTAVMDPTPLHGECLMFWYYMEGRGVGELSVYLQMHDKLTKPTQLWTMRGDQGRHWRHGRVTVSIQSYEWRGVFQAVSIHGTNSTVKIDDYSVMEEACSPTASCDFESGQCTWVNILHEDGHDWMLASRGFLGPLTDHNTETPRGRTSDVRDCPKGNSKPRSHWNPFKSADFQSANKQIKLPVSEQVLVSITSFINCAASPDSGFHLNHLLILFYEFTVCINALSQRLLCARDRLDQLH
uniref:MAM domain-containing protein n=1 Tax=Salarias fasciatus TaxID=181472 RepID=A0A672HCF2_SALFA